MKFNFKKIAAIGTSILLAGMTAGFAAAAAFPAPFVVNGAASSTGVAIVYGTGSGVSPLDLVQAGTIQSALQSYVPSTPGSSVSVSGGDYTTLDNPTARIWLNSSINGVVPILTSNNMPTVLAQTSFSGTVAGGSSGSTIQVTPQIALGNGTTGTNNNNKVVLTKLPSSSNVDPQIGLSVSVISTALLYNATVLFSQPVNFTDAGSIGQVINLFGQPFTVSSATSATQLVLFGSASTITLGQGAGLPSSATVVVNGISHTITLANVGTNTAYITVDGSSSTSVTSGQSKTINNVTVAVTSVASSTAGGNTATILVGANQYTFQDGQPVLVGSNNNVIQGTIVSFQGGAPNSTSKLTIGVYAPNSLANGIVPGMPFVDPVFGTFQLGFNGLSAPIANYTSGGSSGIYVANSGTNLMQVTFTNYNSNRYGITFADNQTVNGISYYNLSDSAGNPIYPYESANMTINTYAPVGTANYGHLLQLQSVTNTSTSTTGSGDQVVFLDVMSQSTYTAKATSKGVAQLNTPDGRQYTVYYGGNGGTQPWYAEIKYPTTEDTSSGYVLYPTIQTVDGAQVALYAPITLNLNNTDGRGTQAGSFYFPNGNLNAYGVVTLTPNTVTGNSSWTITGTSPVTGSGTLLTNLTTGLQSNVTVTVGRLSYMFANNGTTANYTTVYLLQPSNTSTGQILTQPSIVDIEGKDINSNFNAVVITTQNPGTNSNLVGAGSTPYFTATQYQSGSQALVSNTKVTEYLDYFGTRVAIDTTTSGQPVATIANVANGTQEYAQLFVSSRNVIISSNGGSSSLGQILVKDSAVSSVANDNLIIVGGSCINSAAATLVGGAYCGSDWTTATGVGSGQFLIQSFNSTFDSVTGNAIALLVAGYDAPDTVNAATYLTMQKPDMTVGNKFIGTTSTSASLQVA